MRAAFEMFDAPEMAVLVALGLMAGRCYILVAVIRATPWVLSAALISIAHRNITITVETTRLTD